MEILVPAERFGGKSFSFLLSTFLKSAIWKVREQLKSEVQADKILRIFGGETGDLFPLRPPRIRVNELHCAQRPSS